MKAATVDFDQSKLFPLCVAIILVVLPFILIIYAKIRDKRKQEEEQQSLHETLKFNFDPNDKNSDEE